MKLLAEIAGATIPSLGDGFPRLTLVALWRRRCLGLTRRIGPLVLSVGLGIGLGVPSAGAAPMPTTQVFLKTGDAAPDGNGLFSLFSNPALNNEGQMAFFATFTGTDGGSSDDRGIFLGDSPTIEQIVRKGDPAPDGNGTFSNFVSPTLSRDGEVVFRGFLTGTVGGSNDDSGIFSKLFGGSFSQLAREGQQSPDGNGVFSNFGNPAHDNIGVAFIGSLTGTTGGASDNQGIFRHLLGLTTVAREGDFTPTSDGTFSVFGVPALNNLNNYVHIAFQAFLSGATGGADQGLYFDGDAGLVELVREGDSVPDGNGSFLSFGPPALDNTDSIAFRAELFGTSGGTSDDTGIYFSDNTPDTALIVREGDSAPDGNGVFSDFGDPAMNDSSVVPAVAFTGSLRSTTGGSSDDEGIYVIDALIGDIVQIARKGKAAPDGNGKFLNLERPVVNTKLQVAFVGSLTGTAGGPSDDEGIFLFDPDCGLLQVVREGDSLLGSTITAVHFLDEPATEKNGLNDNGQVAYRFKLADGREGISLWTLPIPEPSTAILSLSGLLALAALRRRTRQ